MTVDVEDILLRRIAVKSAEARQHGFRQIGKGGLPFHLLHQFSEVITPLPVDDLHAEDLKLVTDSSLGGLCGLHQITSSPTRGGGFFVPFRSFPRKWAAILPHMIKTAKQIPCLTVWCRLFRTIGSLLTQTHRQSGRRSSRLFSDAPADLLHRAVLLLYQRIQSHSLPTFLL